MERSWNGFGRSLVDPEGLRRMGAEYPVQLSENGVAPPLLHQVAPAIFIVQAEAQELAEVVREVGRDAVPLQPWVDQCVGLVEPETGVRPAIELPLAEYGKTFR